MNHANFKSAGLGLLLWLALPLSAAAEAESTAAAAGAPSPGANQAASGSAAQWLEIQREEKMPGNLLPIPGDEASASYQRYLNTFNSPTLSTAAKSSASDMKK